MYVFEFKPTHQNDQTEENNILVLTMLPSERSHFRHEHSNQPLKDALMIYFKWTNKHKTLGGIKDKWMKTSRGNVVQGRQEIDLTAALTQVP